MLNIHNMRISEGLCHASYPSKQKQLKQLPVLSFCQVALCNGKSLPVVLLANKCDQWRHGMCPKLPKLENFSKEYGFVGWYETSAKAR